jgi:hypothetical protein
LIHLLHQKLKKQGVPHKTSLKPAQFLLHSVAFYQILREEQQHQEKKRGKNQMNLVEVFYSHKEKWA